MELKKEELNKKYIKIGKKFCKLYDKAFANSDNNFIDFDKKLIIFQCKNNSTLNDFMELLYKTRYLNLDIKNQNEDKDNKNNEEDIF